MVGIGNCLKKSCFGGRGQVGLEEEGIKRNLVSIMNALHPISYVGPLLAVSSNPFVREAVLTEAALALVDGIPSSLSDDLFFFISGHLYL
jgi:hypothetical protein